MLGEDSAVARPIPRADPVTIATLPSKTAISLASLRRLRSARSCQGGIGVRRWAPDESPDEWHERSERLARRRWTRRRRRPRNSRPCSISPARPRTHPSGSRRRSRAGWRPGPGCEPARGARARRAGSAAMADGQRRWLAGATTSCCSARPGSPVALTAEYLAGARAARGRAGRSRGATARSSRTSAAGSAQQHAELPLLDAPTSTTPSSIRELAESTKVVITHRRPVHPLRRAARRRLRGGRDRLRRPHRRARVRRSDVAALPRAGGAQTGARIVHSCGFDSIPYDLGALFAVDQLPEGVPIKLEGFVRAGGTFSGGTYHSAVQHHGPAAPGRAGGARAPRARAAAARAVGSTGSAAGRTTTTPPADGWSRSRRSTRRRCCARRRALDRYGPDFSYSHYLVIKRLPAALGLGVRRRRRWSRSRSSSRRATCC